jgi:hypothetical protein
MTPSFQLLDNTASTLQPNSVAILASCMTILFSTLCTPTAKRCPARTWRAKRSSFPRGTAPCDATGRLREQRENLRNDANSFGDRVDDLVGRFQVGERPSELISRAL